MFRGVRASHGSTQMTVTDEQMAQWQTLAKGVRADHWSARCLRLIEAVAKARAWSKMWKKSYAANRALKSTWLNVAKQLQSSRDEAIAQLEEAKNELRSWYGATPFAAEHNDGTSCCFTFGTESCARPVGHRGGHISRSGSQWPQTAKEYDVARKQIHADLDDAREELSEMIDELNKQSAMRRGAEYILRDTITLHNEAREQLSEALRELVDFFDENYEECDLIKMMPRYLVTDALPMARNALERWGK